MSFIPVTITTGSVTNAATMPINMVTYAANYKKIVIEIYNVIPITNNVALYVNLSADGTTYDSGAGNYSWADGYVNYVGGGWSAGSNSDTKIQVINAVGNTTGYQLYTSFTIMNPTNASFFPLIGWIGNYSIQGANGAGNFHGSGLRFNAQATNGISFSMSSGNITASYIITGYK